MSDLTPWQKVRRDQTSGFLPWWNAAWVTVFIAVLVFTGEPWCLIGYLVGWPVGIGIAHMIYSREEKRRCERLNL